VNEGRIEAGLLFHCTSDLGGVADDYRAVNEPRTTKRDATVLKTDL
jgi:hypothetical protein